MASNTMRELLDILRRAEITEQGTIRSEVTLSIDGKAILDLPGDLFEMTVGEFLDRTHARAALTFSGTAPHGYDSDAPTHPAGPGGGSPDEGMTESKPDSSDGGDSDAR